jgi:uncharacterized membrane protein YphA (DoxX/SURF4 family)
MKRTWTIILTRAGRIIFGICIGVFGLQYFIYKGYAGGLPPMPPWGPGGLAGAYLIGAILVVAGSAIAAGYRLPIFATALGAVFFACLAIHFQKLSLVIHDGSARTRAAEVVALGAIAWVIAGGSIPGRGPEATGEGAKPIPHSIPNGRPGGLKIIEEVGRWLLGITLIIFGAQHFMYAAFVASLIPAWIPVHLFFTYLTGVGMIVAGISIATRIYSRVAGILLGSMFLFWVVFLHAPRIMAQIRNGDEWTSGFIALAMGAGAFVVADRGRAITGLQNAQRKTGFKTET